MIDEESSKTKTLVKRYFDAIKLASELKKQLVSAECEVSNSTNELGRHLVPKDAIPSEKFSIWINKEGKDVLCEITYEHNNYVIKFRDRR